MESTFDIAWDAKATTALRKYYNYYKKNASVLVAERFTSAIAEAVETLLEQPERYPVDKHLAHLPQTYRALPVWNFKIVYEFTGFDIFILFIYHTKQSPARIRREFEN
ncbi:MAG: type II toxin-antitoxin system RelE/ParE family toxin [Saprospiraceae bacterium]